VDVVQWDSDPAKFVANALSPAQVVSVVITELENTAAVTVPDRQLSLAIGKEGQNARLAAKLTGWRIDIKSQTAAEQEEHAEPQAGLTGMIAEPEPFEAEEPRRQPTRLHPDAEEAAEEGAEPAAAQIVEPAGGVVEQPAAAAPVAGQRPLGPRLRFAEDLTIPPLQPAVPARGDKAAPKRGGRKGPVTDEEVAAAAAAARAKRTKRGAYVPVEDEEEEEDEYAYLTRHR
jgi:N utilization substance protein A